MGIPLCEWIVKFQHYFQEQDAWMERIFRNLSVLLYERACLFFGRDVSFCKLSILLLLLLFPHYNR